MVRLQNIDHLLLFATLSALMVFHAQIIISLRYFWKKQRLLFSIRDVFYISFEVVGKPIDREWFCM